MKSELRHKNIFYENDLSEEIFQLPFFNYT